MNFYQYMSVKLQILLPNPNYVSSSPTQSHTGDSYERWVF